MVKKEDQTERLKAQATNWKTVIKNKQNTVFSTLLNLQSEAAPQDNDAISTHEREIRRHSFPRRVRGRAECLSHN